MFTKLKSQTLATNVFKSVYGASEYTNVNVGIIQLICQGSLYSKTGTSKATNTVYKFEYTEDEPTKLMKKGVLYNNQEEYEKEKQLKVLIEKNDNKLIKIKKSLDKLHLNITNDIQKMKLIKIEEGICDGEVLYHDKIKKTPALQLVEKRIRISSVGKSLVLLGSFLNK
jgi:hypothetical protein